MCIPFQIVFIFLLFYNNYALNLISNIFECGKDMQSLYGSQVEYINEKNNQTILYVNSNGYGTYNGILQIYYLKNQKIYNEIIVKFPENIHMNNLFNNFGLRYKVYKSDEILVAAPNYNIMKGVVFLFDINPYTYRSKLKQIFLSEKIDVMSFGYSITYNDKYLIISSYDHYIFIYKKIYDEYIYLNSFFKTVSHYYGHQLFLYNEYLFTSDTNTLYIYHLKDNHKYTIASSCKYFGSFMNHNNYDILSISCTYNEWPINENAFFNSKIYLYNYVYNGTLILNQTIYPPNPDIHFGRKVEFTDNSLFISGNRSIYHYIYYNHKYNYVNVYLLPETTIPYDQSFKIIDNIIYTGIYSLKDYRGCIINHPLINTSFYDQKNNNNNNNNNIPIIINKGDQQTNKQIALFNVNIYVYYIFIVCSLVILISLIVLILYCCFYKHIIHFQTNDKKKKKKKKDEKESPFTVHSYVGYFEEDYFAKNMENKNTDNKESVKEDNKNETVKNTNEMDEDRENKSPYKVYSYVGYNENDFPKYTKLSYIEKERAYFKYYNTINKNNKK